MTTSITAVHEGGMLRPTTPLLLPEGTHVELVIVTQQAAGDPPSGRVAAERLAEIAKLSSAHGHPRTSDDHDQILYGESGAR